MPEDEEFEVRTAAIEAESAFDGHDNLKFAFLMINLKTFQIGVHWLPSFFRRPMPKVLREEIVRRLRFHADMLESGELEREMQKYVEINDPEMHGN
jgi:hypothetical protein